MAMKRVGGSPSRVLALIFATTMAGGCQCLRSVDDCRPATCVALGAQCGTVSDGCGTQLECGGCIEPARCGAAGVPNVCNCVPQTCASRGATCGTVSDGCGQMVNCGGCGPQEVCGGGGTANTCACVPRTCAEPNATCGAVSDGCSSTLSCGACSGNFTCAGNSCVACSGAVCANTCVDPLTDLLHCGGCMKQCPPAPANATNSCDAGACGWTCGAAFVDCDAVPANGCEMPLTQQQSDAKNCGACGHDCLGGSCVGGKCQSRVVVSGLVTGFVVYEIAVDQGFLYWVDPTSSNTTGIRQLPLDGGSSIVLASVPEGLSIGYPSAIKVNDERVYALVSSYDGVVLSVGVDGGAPVAMPTSRHPRGLAIDRTAVYWGTQPQSAGYGVLMKAPFDGGTATLLLNEPLYIEDVATDGFSVFWATGGGRVMRAGIDGGAPSVVAMGQSPSRLAVDARHLYWTNSAQGTVMKAPLDGGPAVLLAANQGQPVGIALDSTHLYWANVRDNRVMSVTLSGGTPREVTAVDAGPDVGIFGGPFGLALDEKNIYFTQPLRGLIWRVAK